MWSRDLTVPYKSTLSTLYILPLFLFAWLQQIEAPNQHGLGYLTVMNLFFFPVDGHGHLPVQRIERCRSEDIVKAGVPFVWMWLVTLFGVNRAVQGESLPPAHCRREPCHCPSLSDLCSANGLICTYRWGCIGCIFYNCWGCITHCRPYFIIACIKELLWGKQIYQLSIISSSLFPISLNDHMFYKHILRDFFNPVFEVSTF